MLRASLRGFRYPVEALTLAALRFFLLLPEARKNLARLAFVPIWIANRMRARDALQFNCGGSVHHGAIRLAISPPMTPQAVMAHFRGRSSP